jgi:cytoskeletal protein CcmA (bactofilin family)
VARLLSPWHWLHRRGASGGGPEGGMALIMSISVAFIVFALGAVWIGLGSHQVTATGRDKLREQARNVAEAGLNAAMSGLSANASFTGFGLTAITGGEFEVSVLPVSLDPSDPRRYLVAKGYAPTKAHPRRVARRLEQQVELLPMDGFRYALFTYPGGVSGANYMTVNGDVYASGDLTLQNNAMVAGAVTALGSVTTTNNTTIAGDVQAGNNVTLDNANTTVLGNVFAGGNVTMTGRVKGNVQAGGTISGGTVDGSRSPSSPPAPPAPQTLPTFTWDPANYPAVWNWATPSAFQTYWSSRLSGFSGAHRVGCPAPCTTAVDIGSRWTITDDTTIVAGGPITLSRDLINGAGHPVTLTFVSFATDNGSTPAITMFNNVTLPDDVNVVFYAPNGTVKFSNLKHFTGTVYAANVALDQQFTLTFKPVTLAGFDFDLTSSTHFQIQAGAFKEVPFS